MDTFILVFNKLSALGALGFLILSGFLLATRIQKKENKVSLFVTLHTLRVVLAASLAAMIGSLIYSNIIGFPPCDLCWYQRIFMYPLVFISGYALYKNHTGWVPYAKLLTLVGGAISLFHTVIYYTNVNPFPCSATASCTARYVWELGFMTIPLMALSIFIFIYLALLIQSSKDKASIA